MVVPEIARPVVVQQERVVVPKETFQRPTLINEVNQGAVVEKRSLQRTEVDARVNRPTFASPPHPTQIQQTQSVQRVQQV